MGGISPEHAKQEIFLAHVMGWVVAGAGSLILAGWIADLPLLRSILPQQVEAKANTAVCFILAGVALILKTGRFAPNAAKFCAAFAAAIGLATLGEYVGGWNLGIDELLFRDSAAAAYTVHPGRMAPPTALCFVFMGMALLLLKVDRHRIAVAWLAAPAAFLAALGFVGQLYDLPYLMSFGPYTPIDAPTGITLLLLSTGALLAGCGQLVARIRRAGRALGLMAAVGLLLVMGGAVVRNTYALIENNHQVNHTHEVLGRLSGVLAAVQDVETGARSYVLTGDQRFLEPYEAAPATLDKLQRELRELIRDNPALLRRLDQLENLVAAKLAVSQAIILLRQQGDIAGAQSEIASGRGRKQMVALRQVLNDMRREETRLLELRQTQVDNSTLRTLLTLGLGLVITIVLLLAIFGLLAREVAAHQQTETALRRSEENLAVTLNSIGDAVLSTDTAGRVMRMNRMAEVLTGWKRAEARGRPIAEVFHIVNEESRAPAPIPVDEVLATGEIRQLTTLTAQISRDGTERSIADSAAPIRDPEGRVLGVVLVFRDMTGERAARKAQHESEARYRTLFESIDQGFCLVEMIFDRQEHPVDYRFIETNPAFEKQSGLKDAVGRTMREFAPNLEREWFETLGRVAVTGEPARYHNRASSLNRAYDIYAFRFGNPVKRQVAVLFSDITDRQRAQEELLQSAQKVQAANLQLQAANTELEAFSYSVSHDLRAPLRHVQGYVEMLTHEAQAQLTDKARRYLTTITDAAREMGQLIDDLLAFSRMGRTEMQETTVDLAPLIQEIRQMLERTVPGRNIRWHIAPLPKVRGDPAMLRQVLANLLDNAVKYTRPRNPAEIEIGCAGEEEGRIILFVRDNGTGFEMKYAGKLFGVFQRLHRADEFEGTGIGLATVRRTIARHGGRTWADAKLDAGATFYFTLAPAPAGPTPTPDQS